MDTLKKYAKSYFEYKIPLYVKDKISLQKEITAVNLNENTLDNKNVLFTLLDKSEIWKKKNGIQNLHSTLEITNQLTDIIFIPVDEIVIEKFEQPVFIDFLSNPDILPIDKYKFNQFLIESFKELRVEYNSNKIFSLIDKKQNDVDLQDKMKAFDKKYKILFWEKFYSGEIFSFDEYLNTIIDAEKINSISISYEEYMSYQNEKIYALTSGGGFIIKRENLKKYI